jgi:hypothetical protein
MANKSELVDLISAATRQKYRRPVKRTATAAEEKEERRLSHWPPDHMEQWRLVNLTPWKMKLRSWKFKDWV